MKTPESHIFAQGFKSRKQLASDLGISRRTLYNYIRKHDLPVSNGLLSPSEQALILQALNPGS